MRRTSSLRLGLIAALVGAVALVALALFENPAQAESGQILGTAPPAGQLGLIVWSGGTVEEIAPAAQTQGCPARSVWANKSGGGLVGYLFGAPSFVNRGFLDRYGGGSLPELTPLILVCAPAPSSSSPSTGTSTLSADEALLLGLINDERVTRGLAALRVDLTMSAVARAHSADMGERDFFDHTNPDGESPFDRMTAGGVNYRSAGENIAWANGVEQAHELLMDSPGHRANLLNPDFGRMGIGVTIHPEHGRLVTQVFAD